MRTPHLLLLLLIVALVLPGVALTRPVTSAPIAAIAPQDVVAPPDSDAALAKASDKKAQRKAKSRAEANLRKQQGRSTGDTSGSGAQAEPPTCTDGLVPLGDTGRCTHGPDPAPPGIDTDPNRTPVSAREASRQTAGIACEGNGQDGFRVQVIYAYDSAKSSRFATYANSIRAWAADADQIMRDSSRLAPTSGGEELHFLFVHNASCLIEVQEVAFPASAMNSFGTMMTNMESRGFTRYDRIYLIFADSSKYCGIGTLWPDDRDSVNNWNNSGPSYARVDASCWSGRVAAHEMMHNLGGVQDSAPNSSRGGHCIDEYDVMCYSDDPYYPTMQVRCSDQSTFEFRYDCNYDDYLNPNPASGSYLDTHWNTADSLFLTQDVPGGWTPNPPVGAPTIVMATSGGSVKSKKHLGLAASVSNVPADGASVSFQMCRGSSCTPGAGAVIATLSGGEPSTTWRASGRGQVTFIAQVTTSAGSATSDPVTVNVKKAKKKR
ncbi:MAG: hypothetical protein QM692_23365 [Thermomicrobiales bacterium]